MSLKDRITDDMKASMRSGEKERLGDIRMITSAIKQRKESVVQFQAGNRQDLVDKENSEIALLQGYLPSQLSEVELDSLIGEAVVSTGASSIKDMGKVMAIIKSKAQGRADMAAVGAKIKARLSG